MKKKAKKTKVKAKKKVAPKRASKKPAKRKKAPRVAPEDGGATLVLSHAEVLGDIETSLALATLREDV